MEVKWPEGHWQPGENTYEANPGNLYLEKSSLYEVACLSCDRHYDAVDLGKSCYLLVLVAHTALVQHVHSFLPLSRRFRLGLLNGLGLLISHQHWRNACSNDYRKNKTIGLGTNSPREAGCYCYAR